MGECILAGHPPMGPKIAYGRFVPSTTFPTVDLSGYGFKSAPAFVASIENRDYSLVLTVQSVTATSASLYFTGNGGNSINPTSCCIDWVAIGT